MTAPRAPRVVIAAVGSEFRRDDAAGAVVLDRLAGRVAGAEMLGAFASPLQLLGTWDGADLAIVVDAVAMDGAPGGVRVMELDMTSPPESCDPTATTPGSHGLGVIDAVRIARALGTAPVRVTLVGIAGEDFGHGAGLTPSVRRGVARAADLVVELARRPPVTAG